MRIARVWSARPEPQEAHLVGQVVQRATALLSARAAVCRRLHRRRARRERAAGPDRRARSGRRGRLDLHLRGHRARRRSCRLRLRRQDERPLIARERRDADARREGRRGALHGALGRSERRAPLRLIPDRTPHTEPGAPAPLLLWLRVLRVELFWRSFHQVSLALLV